MAMASAALPGAAIPRRPVRGGTPAADRPTDHPEGRM